MISLSSFIHNDLKQYRLQLTQWIGVRYLPEGSWSRVMTLSLLVCSIGHLYTNCKKRKTIFAKFFDKYKRENYAPKKCPVLHHQTRGRTT